jgi:hypothetical protein
MAIDQTVKTSERLWSEEVKKADNTPEQKPTYEFSNGRVFVEPKRTPSN